MNLNQKRGRINETRRKEIEKFELSGDLLQMVIDYLKLAERHSVKAY